MPERGPVLEIEGLDAFYGSAHILHGVGFSVGDESVAIVGRNGMGKTTLCAAIMGLMPSFKGSAKGLDPLSRQGARREAVVQDREPRHRLRAPGAAPVPIALGRRAPAHARPPGERFLDDRANLRTLPAARREEAKRRRAALGRRAADAGDRPRAADEPEAPDHGRAVGGARPGDHRGADLDASSASRRRGSASC